MRTVIRVGNTLTREAAAELLDLVPAEHADAEVKSALLYGALFGLAVVALITWGPALVEFAADRAHRISAELEREASV